MYIKSQVGDDLINMIVKVFLPKYGIEKSEIEKISSIKVGLKSIIVSFEDKILETYFDHPLGFENPIMKTLSIKVLVPVDQKVKSEKVTKVKSKKVNDETWREVLNKCKTNEVPWKLGLRTLLEDKGFKIVAQRTNEFYYFFLINPEISKTQSAQIEISLSVIKRIFSGSSDNELAKDLITRTSISLEHELLKNYVQIPEKVKKENVAKNAETSTESSEVTSEPETESPSESQSEQVTESAPEELTQEIESEHAPESETQVITDGEDAGTESGSTEE